MQVSATTLAQNLTIKKENASLKAIFTEIRKQTGYIVLYQQEQIKSAKAVTLDISSLPIDQAMSQILKDQNLSFEIEDKSIIITTKREPSFLDKAKSAILNLVQDLNVRGRILDENGQALVGASVLIKGSDRKTITNDKGEFSFTNIDEGTILIISYIGYETKEVFAKVDLGMVKMTITTGKLDEVSVVSTGYQNAKPNEINGTISLIDEKAINSRSGTNILDRLIGQSSGLMLQVGKTSSNPQNKTNISIRGLGTINGPLDPLIVLDGFIYEGDIENINPNDIESVSILKDAAASSIWGARAGNGVIVITSKKGKFNQAMQLSFNSNFLLQSLPKLNAVSQIDNLDYIALERKLFDAGYFNDKITSTPWASLTAVVEILLAQRNGKISSAAADQQIERLSNNNTQQSYLDNFYTRALTQQHSLNIRGGGERNSYLLSAAYDHVRGETFSSSDKINLHLANDFKLNKIISLNTNVYFTNLYSKSGRPSYNSLSVGGRYPTYLDFSHTSGLAMKYRANYTDTVANRKFLDWKYYPDQDYIHDYFTGKSQELYANVGMTFQIVDGLDLQISYQYQRQNRDDDHTSDIESFAARDLINTYSQYNSSTGIVTYPVPLGGILSTNSSQVSSQTGRAQLNYNKIFGVHKLTAIFGSELRASNSSGTGTTKLGYQEDPLYFSLVDQTGYYPEYLSGNNSQIGGSNTISSTAYRFISLYSNLSYTYRGKYILSGSIRRDGSNIFGANTNDKWKPLWSAGIGWQISDENFYNLDWLPVLKLTGSFGYSGNVDLTKTASPVAGYASNVITGFPITRINSINNPDLRWEQLSQLSIRVDFESAKKKISGSLSWYTKNGTDLYGQSSYDYTTWGAREFITRNVADMKGKGLDLDLHTKNLNADKFNWTTDMYFSYSLSRTEKYYSNTGSSIYALLSGGKAITPLEGYPLYSIAAYKWGGLDVNGNPQGYLNGVLSTNYSALLAEATKDGSNLIYKGSASPTYFGALINNFNWNGFSLSVNINFKLGYHVRKPSINYSQLIGGSIGNSEFAKRWQNPGDEQHTNVPSFVYPTSSLRDAFYYGSEVNIMSGDHIRLDYIRLGYSINTSQWKFPFRALEAYSGLQNVGLIWKSNTMGYDPDYAGFIPPSRQITFGLKGSF